MQRRNVYKITNTTVSEKKKVEKKSKSKQKIEIEKLKNRNKKSINRRKNRNSGEDCYRIVCLIAISLNQHCMN